MSDQLVIRILPNIVDVGDKMLLEWGFVSVAGKWRDQSQGIFSVFSQWLNDVGIVVACTDDKAPKALVEATLLLPGTLCSSYQIPTTPSQRKHLKKAVPFLVEEWLAQEIDTLQLTSYVIDKKDCIQASAIDKELLRQLLVVFDSVNVNPVFIVADNFLLNSESDSDVKLLFDGNNALLSISDDVTQTLDLEALELVLQPTLDKLIAVIDSAEHVELGDGVDVEQITNDDGRKKEKKVVLTLLARASEVQPHYDRVISFLERSGLSGKIEVKLEQVVDSGLFFQLLPIRFWTDSKLTALNLRSGEFACVRKLNENWKKWRLTLYLVIAWMLLEVFISLGYAFWLETQADAFYEESLALYRSVFPKERLVADVKSQLGRYMKQMEKTDTEKESTFLELLRQATTVLPEESRVLSLDYNDATLFLEMVVNSKEAAQFCIDQMNQVQLRAKIQGIRQEPSGKVIAKIEIRFSGKEHD